jgi:hypothetical protein
MAEAQGLQE